MGEALDEIRVAQERPAERDQVRRAARARRLRRLLRTIGNTVTANRSKSRENRLRCSAHGAGTIHTLPSANRRRGNRHTSTVSNWHGSRCRQLRSTGSCTGRRSRLSGHAHSVPAR